MLSQPNDEGVERELAEALRTLGARATVTLRVGAVGRRKTDYPISPGTVAALAQLLEIEAAGESVEVVPTDREISTQVAANILGVSRPYLVKLLDEEAIPHRRVGNRRRARLADILRYQQIEDARSRDAARALTEESQRLGLY